MSNTSNRTHSIIYRTVAFIRDMNHDTVSGLNAAYVAWCPDRLTSRVPFCCEQRERSGIVLSPAATIILSSCYVKAPEYANDRVSRAINETRGDASLSLIVPSRVLSEHTNFLRPDRWRGSTGAARSCPTEFIWWIKNKIQLLSQPSKILTSRPTGSQRRLWFTVAWLQVHQFSKLWHVTKITR